jgi:hypothetical protein
MRERYWLWLGARLVVALVIAGWAFSYLMPGGGEKEFQKSLDALKHVRSVRVAYAADPTATQHDEISWDLVCSQDAFRYKWHVVESNPSGPADLNRDELHVGALAYDHQPDDSWQKAKYGSGPTPKSYCTRLAEGSDTNLTPPLATMLKRGVLQKGEKKTVSGVRCREWQVTMKGGYSGLEHDTVCLGLDDHLPYELTVDYQHSRTTFSDYNSGFQLDMPAATVQSASATN